MNADDLRTEISRRGLDKSVVKVTKDECTKILKRDLAGISRAPALCFGKELTDLQTTNLSKYEVLPVEPLHDTKGHIKNVWDVLPEVLDEGEKKLFSDSLAYCFGNKDTIRGSDYRLSVIITYQNMKGKCHINVEELLYTLMEIVRLAYMKAEKRSPKYILRLYNICFQHSLCCLTVLGKKRHAISVQKLYGIYYHSLTVHLPEIARIVSPSSFHTENEEQVFSQIKQISLATSSRAPDSMRDNCILRMQVEKQLKASENISKLPLSSCQSKISKFGATIGTNYIIIS